MTERVTVAPVLAAPEDPVEQVPVSGDLAARIARDYGAAVPEGLAVARYRCGVMATAETIPRAAAISMGWRAYLRGRAHRRAARLRARGGGEA